MDIKELKELIDATIYPNGEKKIKASSHQTMLHEIVDYTDENITTINEDLEEVKNTLETQEGDVEQLKENSKQTELNDAKVNQKIDNLASNIVGLGGDIKGSAKGADVIELPSVTINGVAPKAKTEGLTLVNVINNGNFNNGVNGWWSTGSTLSIVDGFLKSKMKDGRESGNALYDFLWQSSDIVAIVLKYRDYDNISKITLQTNIRVFYTEEVLNGKLLFVGSLPSGRNTFIGLNHFGGDLTIESFQLISLTQMFGKGNEPTKEWCDKHIKGYIDGMQSVQIPLRVKSVGENLFDYLDIDNHTKYIRVQDRTVTCSVLGGLYTIVKFPTWEGVPYVLSLTNLGESTSSALKYSIQTKFGTYSPNDTIWITAGVVKDGQIVKSKLIIPEYTGYHYLIVNSYVKAVDIMLSRGDVLGYSKYNDSYKYINSSIMLKSALQAKDYIENGTLFKNVFTTKEFKKDDIRRQYINESLVNTYAFYFDVEENIWLKDGFSDNTNRIALFSDGETYQCVGSTIATDVEDIVFFIEGGINYIVLKVNKTKIDKLTGDTPLDKFKAYMGSRSLIINYQANTEQTKLDTSGVVTTKADGTIFIENIKNVTDFYTTNGLDVKDFKELVSIYKYEGSDLIQLDASKAVFTTTLKHPDLQDGDLVFFEYKYLDSPLWGDNEIEYFNKNNVLQSENGKLWQKVEKASNEGVLTTELKEIV